MQRNQVRMLSVVAGVMAIGVGWAHADIISGNYCSVAPVVTFPAGYVPADNWNDLTGPAGFSPNDSVSDPIYDDGSTATGAMIAWTTSEGGSQNTNDYVQRPGDIDDGHDELMAGYLQASKYSSFTPLITLEATGLDLGRIAGGDGTYDLILYFDGDDDVESLMSKAMFEIWNSEADYQGSASSVATYYGRDVAEPDPLSPALQYPIVNDGTDPISHYVQIDSTDPMNPTDGNYVMFSGLQQDSFYVRISGEAGEDGHGVALNGFQIVPEPASVLLVLAGLLLRRR